MSSFHPLHAYWIGPAPNHQALAAGLAAQARSLGVTMHADEGLLFDLPAGMALFLDHRVGGCAEFAISRPDWRLPFGAVEEARLEQIVSHVMGALVRDLSAVACFVGRVRLDHMLDEVEEFGGAMASRAEPAPLPLERLGGTTWMRRWRAALPAGIEPQRVVDQVACHDDGPVPLF